MDLTISTIIGDFILIAGSFLLLIFLVKKYAWGNLTNILDERAEKISSDIDEQKLPVRRPKNSLANVKLSWQVAVRKLRQLSRMQRKQLRKVELTSWLRRNWKQDA